MCRRFWSRFGARGGNAAPEAQLFDQGLDDLVRLGRVPGQVSIILSCDFLSNEAHIRDARFLRCIDFVPGRCTHELHSNLIKSGVTNSGSCNRARAATTIKCVRLFGLAKCL